MKHPIDGGRERGRALVTGGAVRVGRAIALGLADAGYDVTIHYHRSEREVERTVRALRDRGRDASAARADLTQPDEIRALLAPESGYVSDLSVLVNSAACFPRCAPESVTVDDWDRVFALNARAPFLCAQAAFSQLRARGGAVINIADVAAFEAWPAYVPYAATKAAVVSMTRGLARAWAPVVRVNAVCPGAILLPDTHSDRERRGAESRAALGRIGDPADVAGAVVYLAGARFITGEVLTVDGGTHLRRV